MKWLGIGSLLLAFLAAGFGWREHARAAQLGRELEQARRAQAHATAQASECRQSTFSSLGKVLSTLKRRPPPPPTVAARDGAKESDKKLEDLSPDDQVKLFDLADKAKERAGEDLAALRPKLHLTGEQDQKLTQSIAQMNERIGKAFDRLTVLVSQEEKPRPIAIIDALADGFGAVRDADEGFRATLDDDQRKMLDEAQFDMTKQVDTTAVLLKVIALTSAMPQQN